MIIHRFGEPSKQDVMGFGSVCLTKMNTQSSTLLYLQLSHTENEPSWSFIGEFHPDLTEQQAEQIAHKILYPD